VPEVSKNAIIFSKKKNLNFPQLKVELWLLDIHANFNFQIFFFWQVSALRKPLLASGQFRPKSKKYKN